MLSLLLQGNNLEVILGSSHLFRCYRRPSLHRQAHHHCRYQHRRILDFDILESFRLCPKLLGRNRHHLHLHHCRRHRYLRS